MIGRLLLAASGVDRDLLRLAPREHAKYVGVGGAIVTTAVLAAISMGFALRTALDAVVVVVVVGGLLWGAAIFNLDRWIVAATKRQDSWWRDIAMALPRLALAVVIGAVISEPLVLKVFEPEIEAELQVMHNEEQAAFEDQLARDPRFAALPAMRQEAVDLQRELDAGVPADAVTAHPEVRALRVEREAVDGRLAQAEAALACEGLGTCGSGNAGAGPVFRENVARRDRLADQSRALTAQLASREQEVAATAAASFRARAADLRSRIDDLGVRVRDAEDKRRTAVREHDGRVSSADGLLARVEALGRLSAREKDLAHARWGLFAFILVLECMPVLVKLLMNLAKPGVYDRLLQQHDEHDLAQQGLRLSTQQQEARIEAQVALDAADQKARCELDAHVRAAQIVLDAQVQLVELTMERWRHEQGQLIAANERPELVIDLTDDDIIDDDLIDDDLIDDDLIDLDDLSVMSGAGRQPSDL